jgi:HEAT repeat protein
VDAVASYLERRAGADASLLSRANAAMAVAAVEALAEARPPSAEEPLVVALASSVPGVALAAARGLARVGTARVIPALRQSEPQRGDLRSAARQAIAAIRSRLTDARPGQVSLAGGGEGQVSLAGDSDGRVSLEPDPTAR